MPRDLSTRPPTPFYRRGPDRAGDNRAFSPSRTSVSPCSSTSTLVTSAWIDTTPSPSSSPSASEWDIVTLPQPHPPPPFLSSDAGYGVAPFALVPLPYPAPGHHLNPWPAPYASPPPLDRGFVSPTRTGTPSSPSSSHTRSSTLHRSYQDGRGQRTLDSVPCQMCLLREMLCTCRGGETARLRMREAAREVLNRTGGMADSGLARRSEEPLPALQAPAWASGFAPEFGYTSGYGAPTVSVVSPFVVYVGYPVWMGGFTSGYYGGPGPVLISQTGVHEQQGGYVPVRGVDAGQWEGTNSEAGWWRPVLLDRQSTLA